MLASKDCYGRAVVQNDGHVLAVRALRRRAAWDVAARYTFGSKGEYQEVEYLEIRQMYDEYKHARMYEDAVLQLGYVDSRKELFAHPWCQFSPEALGLHTFLQRLGNLSHCRARRGQSSGQ